MEKTLVELRKIKSVAAVYLFGSYATGRQLAFSDIDICVITEKDIPTSEKPEISSVSFEKIEVVVFWDLPIYIRYRVLKEGNPLFVRDKKFLHSVTIETLWEYLDFKPIIERFSEIYFGDRKWIKKESSKY